MSIIIISSDSREIEQETAEQLSESTGLKTIGRDDILPMVAEKYKVSIEELKRVLEKRPSVLKSSFRRWKLLLSYIEEAVAEELIKDNLICYGLAAHLYILGVSHALRVRVVSNEEKRIQEIVSNSGVNSQVASKLLEKEKKKRARWSMELFGRDETDSSRYDLSINLNNIDLDETIKLIEETVSYRRFKTMTYSMKCIEDLALVARARAVLIKQFPDVKLMANNGKLVVTLLSLRRQKKKKTKIIKEMTSDIRGIDYVEVHVFNDYFGQAAESFR